MTLGRLKRDKSRYLRPICQFNDTCLNPIDTQILGLAQKKSPREDIQSARYNDSKDTETGNDNRLNLKESDDDQEALQG